LKLMSMTTTTQSPEQLQLLPEAAVPVQFRLDEATRRRGLAHIARIRAQLDRARSERASRPAAGRRVRELPARSVKPHAA
jgi:hypothetical protein